MLSPFPRLSPSGDSAVLVEFADGISDEANDRVHALAAALAAQHRAEILDLVPAYSSLLCIFDLEKTSYDQVCNLIQDALTTADISLRVEPRVIEIPTRYGGEFGPDLAFVAEASGLSEAEIIRLHVSAIYRVYFIGFSPGFAYLGTLDEKIIAPRLATPRALVPAGSVAVAGHQTGIYPTATPGGWRIIGRTAAKLFDPTREPPVLLRAGDRVKFVTGDGCQGMWASNGWHVLAAMAFR